MDQALLVVLGMGRSGSSLLSGLLNMAGLSIPGALLPAGADNPKGFWEPVEVLEINQAYLERMGSSWFDPSLAPLLRPEPLALAQLERDIAAFLDRHPLQPMAIKEPRMVMTAPSWIAAAQAAGYRLCFALPLRDPGEVIGSLIARDGLDPDHAARLWLKYSLAAERLTRGRQAVVVAYEAVLADWQGQLGRIGARLGLPLDPDRTNPGDQRLPDPALRHQRSDRLAIGPLAAQAMLDAVYQQLLCAARDQPADLAVLDAALAQLCSAENLSLARLAG